MQSTSSSELKLDLSTAGSITAGRAGLLRLTLHLLLFTSCDVKFSSDSRNLHKTELMQGGQARSTLLCHYITSTTLSENNLMLNFTFTVSHRLVKSMSLPRLVLI